MRIRKQFYPGETSDHVFCPVVSRPGDPVSCPVLVVAVYQAGYKGGNVETPCVMRQMYACPRDALSPLQPWRLSGLEIRHSYAGGQSQGRLGCPV